LTAALAGVVGVATLVLAPPAGVVAVNPGVRVAGAALLVAGGPGSLDAVVFVSIFLLLLKSLLGAGFWFDVGGLTPGAALVEAVAAGRRMDDPAPSFGVTGVIVLACDLLLVVAAVTSTFFTAGVLIVSALAAHASRPAFIFLSISETRTRE
jgi:hypothetical protein